RIYNDPYMLCSRESGASLNGNPVLLGEEFAEPPHEVSEWSEFWVSLPYSRLGRVKARRYTPVMAYVLAPDANEFIAASGGFCGFNFYVSYDIWTFKSDPDD